MGPGSHPSEHLLPASREARVGFHPAPRPREPSLSWAPHPPEGRAQEFVCLLLLELLNIREMHNGTVTQ